MKDLYPIGTTVPLSKAGKRLGTVQILEHVEEAGRPMARAEVVECDGESLPFELGQVLNLPMAPDDFGGTFDLSGSEGD